MRTLIRITPDVEKASAALKNGTFEKLVAETTQRLKPEAAYYFADHGNRTANFVCDLESSAEMPSIAEPWFQEVNATVEFFPCMNTDDLQRGLQKIQADTRETVHA